MDWELVKAIVVLALKAPFLLLGFLLRHRWFLVVAAIAFVALIAVNSYQASRPPETEVPKHQVSAPTRQDAPFVVHTSSRVYYVVDYEDDGETVILNDFFSYDRKRWDRNTVPLPLPREFYGEILIYER